MTSTYISPKAEPGVEPALLIDYRNCLLPSSSSSSSFCSVYKAEWQSGSTQHNQEDTACTDNTSRHRVWRRNGLTRNNIHFGMYVVILLLHYSAPTYSQD